MSPTDISKQMSMEWKAMSDAEKQSYTDTHNREMAIYKVSMRVSLPLPIISILCC